MHSPNRVTLHDNGITLSPSSGMPGNTNTPAADDYERMILLTENEAMEDKFIYARNRYDSRTRDMSKFHFTMEELISNGHTPGPWERSRTIDGEYTWTVCAATMALDRRAVAIVNGDLALPTREESGLSRKEHWTLFYLIAYYAYTSFAARQGRLTSFLYRLTEAIKPRRARQYHKPGTCPLNTPPRSWSLEARAGDSGRDTPPSSPATGEWEDCTPPGWQTTDEGHAGCGNPSRPPSKMELLANGDTNPECRYLCLRTQTSGPHGMTRAASKRRRSDIPRPVCLNKKAKGCRPFEEPPRIPNSPPSSPESMGEMSMAQN